ncbi:MAG: hypothetical protein Q9181_005138 [Wetmoreana brouardii]
MLYVTPVADPIDRQGRVVPPPPRPPLNVYNPNVPGGMTTIALDTSNTIGHPSGPEYQLAVGEGIYLLQDDVHLATPPPHPSEHTTANPNPLATVPLPPTTGVKISLSRINPRKPPHLYKLANIGSTRSNLATYSIKESEKESRSSHETSSDGLTAHLVNGAAKTPVFGEDNAFLTPTLSKDGVKRKKPKTNIVKSNSSWISRVMPHEAMTKRIQEHNPEGLFAFANINRAFQWLDLSSNNESKAQHIIKILFTKAHILCHDINLFTKGPNHLDLIMGASTGDIMWFEAFSQKYARINKNAVINPSPIHQIRWLPGSENLFLAAHMDGTLIVYDKERDDAAFVPEDSSPLLNFARGSDMDPRPLHVKKSVNSRNQKSNPVASWKISNHRINDFAFAPDSRHLAVVTEDGYLHIIDYLNEQLNDIYSSYYGGFLCVCWSPDGKYILTGGQDDLVSIWSLVERRLVARCPGHNSWVSCVAFDPWRCDDRNYRFGSVGEDRRLLLWDFNVGMLHRPKALSVRQRGSISSHTPITRNRTESQATMRFRSSSNLTADSVDGEGLVEHPVESRTRTAELPPVMSLFVAREIEGSHSSACTNALFSDDGESPCGLSVDPPPVDTPSRLLALVGGGSTVGGALRSAATKQGVQRTNKEFSDRAGYTYSESAFATKGTEGPLSLWLRPSTSTCAAPNINFMALRLFGNSANASSVKYFEIRLDQSTIILRGNEVEASSVVLKGTLVLCLAEPLKVQSVRVAFNLPLDSLLTTERSWGQGVTTNAKKDEVFLRHVWEFLNTGLKRGDTLEAGNYEWPFDHVLPGYIPESVEGLWDSWIIYRMKATIDRGLLTQNVLARKHVRVVRTLDTAALELSQENQADGFEAVGNTWDGKVDYSFSTPTKGVIFGTAVPVKFRIVPLLKGLSIREVNIEINETHRIVIGPRPTAIKTPLRRLVAVDKYDVPEDQPTELVDGQDAWVITRQLSLPKSLRHCLQTVDALGINIRHMLMLTVKLINPDEHTSEVHASLPLHIYISPNLPLDENNNTVMLGSQGTDPTALAVTAPPLYGEHHLDMLFSDIDPAGYMTPAGGMSGAGTPFNSQSRRGSATNVASLDTMASSSVATALEGRLSNLEAGAGNRVAPSHRATSSSGDDPSPGASRDLPLGTTPYENPNLSDSQQDTNERSSRRTSDNGSENTVPGPQHFEYSPEDMSRVPSYSTALRSHPQTPISEGPPVYQPVTRQSMLQPAISAPTGSIPDARQRSQR